MRARLGRVVVALAALLCAARQAPAGDFTEPPAFRSAKGVLDLLVIAEPKPVNAISFTPAGGHPMHPTGWIYEICARAKALPGNRCPAGQGTQAQYGGVRLALQKGDSLKIRLVNRLPKLDPVKVDHAADPGGANLWRNLTNLHTHGLVVAPRTPTPSDPTFGDYIFMQIYNSQNGTPVPQGEHDHGSMLKDFADYRIDIGAHHPSGAFWFHPHVHGISLNQLSSGLSGIISVGKAGDYARRAGSNMPVAETSVRHLVLKDMQVLAKGQIRFRAGMANVDDGEVLNQEDSAFCAQAAAEERHGSCPGADNSASGGNNYSNGRWYFSVSGQTYPTIKVSAPEGQIWRLTNASASASYDLKLIDDAARAPMLMQVIAVDGVGIDAAGAAAESLGATSGGRLDGAPCPLVQGGGATAAPACVNHLVMMPSSRVEVWVTHRDPTGQVDIPSEGVTATFKTAGLTTGPAGDAWPEVDLAKVEFAPGGTGTPATARVAVRAEPAVSNRSGAAAASAPSNAGTPPPSACAALAQGHRRRIFFGLVDPVNDPDAFGLGYEEIDSHNNVVAQKPVTSFDPAATTICLPLGPGQAIAHETWELVNLATEAHNFHIHQTKYRVIETATAAGAPAAVVLEDNTPLPPATSTIADLATSQNGYCTIDQWHGGQCSSPAVVVDIPFSQIGEFAFHCHILEHEDGGMMAKIQVVPSPN